MKLENILYIFEYSLCVCVCVWLCVCEFVCVCVCVIVWLCDWVIVLVCTRAWLSFIEYACGVDTWSEMTSPFASLVRHHIHCSQYGVIKVRMCTYNPLTMIYWLRCYLTVMTSSSVSENKQTLIYNNA
jgi:hypothetical protein